MADIPTPTPPAPISGYRSRAINAAVDYTTATRPLAGNGVNITDGVGGKTISVAPRGLAQRAAPWQVRAYPEPISTSAVEWKVRVYGGLAILYGAELTAPTEDGTDEATGLKWYEAPAYVQSRPWLCVQNDGEGSWLLAWKAGPIDLTKDAEYRAIAYMVDDGPPPKLMQIDVGVVDISGGGFGPDTPTEDYIIIDLAGNGAYANEDTWNWGDVDEETGKMTAPRYCPHRLFWDESESTHRLLEFSRTSTYNHSGGLIAVSAEVMSEVFTAVSEMP